MTEPTPAPSTPQPPQYSREEAQCLGPYLVSEDPPHYLSAVSPSDIPEMVRILNLDDSVFRNSSYFKFPYPEDLARIHIARADRVIETRGINAHWAMRTSPEGKIMGWVSLHPVKSKSPVTTPTTTTTAAALATTTTLDTSLPSDVKSSPVPESDTQLKDGSEPGFKMGRTGYWVSPEYRNQGYAGRTLAYLLEEIAAKEQGFDLVQGEAFAENLASQRVMERAGMVLESADLVVLVEAYGPGVQKRIATFSWWSPLSPHRPH